MSSASVYSDYYGTGKRSDYNGVETGEVYGMYGTSEYDGEWGTDVDGYIENNWKQIDNVSAYDDSEKVEVEQQSSVTYKDYSTNGLMYSSDKKGSMLGSDKKGSMLGDRKGSMLGSDRKGSMLGSDRKGSMLGSDRKGSMLGDKKGSMLGSDRKGSMLGSDRKGSGIWDMKRTGSYVDDAVQSKEKKMGSKIKSFVEDPSSVINALPDSIVNELLIHQLKVLHNESEDEEDENDDDAEEADLNKSRATFFKSLSVVNTQENRPPTNGKYVAEKPSDADYVRLYKIDVLPLFISEQTFSGAEILNHELSIQNIEDEAMQEFGVKAVFLNAMSDTREASFEDEIEFFSKIVSNEHGKCVKTLFHKLYECQTTVNEYKTLLERNVMGMAAEMEAKLKPQYLVLKGKQLTATNTDHLDVEFDVPTWFKGIEHREKVDGWMQTFDSHRFGYHMILKRIYHLVNICCTRLLLSGLSMYDKLNKRKEAMEDNLEKATLQQAYTKLQKKMQTNTSNVVALKHTLKFPFDCIASEASFDWMPVLFLSNEPKTPTELHLPTYIIDGLFEYIYEASNEDGGDTNARDAVIAECLACIEAIAGAALRSNHLPLRKYLVHHFVKCGKPVASIFQKFLQFPQKISIESNVTRNTRTKKDSKPIQDAASKIVTGVLGWNEVTVEFFIWCLGYAARDLGMCVNQTGHRKEGNHVALFNQLNVETLLMYFEKKAERPKPDGNRKMMARESVLLNYVLPSIEQIFALLQFGLSAANAYDPLMSRDVLGRIGYTMKRTLECTRSMFDALEPSSTEAEIREVKKRISELELAFITSSIGVTEAFPHLASYAFQKCHTKTVWIYLELILKAPTADMTWEAMRSDISSNNYLKKFIYDYDESIKTRRLGISLTNRVPPHIIGDISVGYQSPYSSFEQWKAKTASHIDDTQVWRVRTNSESDCFGRLLYNFGISQDPKVAAVVLMELLQGRNVMQDGSITPAIKHGIKLLECHKNLLPFVMYRSDLNSIKSNDLNYALFQTLTTPAHSAIIVEFVGQWLSLSFKTKRSITPVFDKEQQMIEYLCSGCSEDAIFNWLPGAKSAQSHPASQNNTIENKQSLGRRRLIFAMLHKICTRINSERKKLQSLIENPKGGDVYAGTAGCAEASKWILFRMMKLDLVYCEDRTCKIADDKWYAGDAEIREDVVTSKPSDAEYNDCETIKHDVALMKSLPELELALEDAMSRRSIDIVMLQISWASQLVTMYLQKQPLAFIRQNQTRCLISTITITRECGCIGLAMLLCYQMLPAIWVSLVATGKTEEMTSLVSNLVWNFERFKVPAFLDIEPPYTPLKASWAAMKSAWTHQNSSYIAGIQFGNLLALAVLQGDVFLRGDAKLQFATSIVDACIQCLNEELKAAKTNLPLNTLGILEGLFRLLLQRSNDKLKADIPLVATITPAIASLRSYKIKDEAYVHAPSFFLVVAEALLEHFYTSNVKLLTDSKSYRDVEKAVGSSVELRSAFIIIKQLLQTPYDSITLAGPFFNSVFKLVLGMRASCSETSSKKHKPNSLIFSMLLSSNATVKLRKTGKAFPSFMKTVETTLRRIFKSPSRSSKYYTPVQWKAFTTYGEVLSSACEFLVDPKQSSASIEDVRDSCARGSAQHVMDIPSFTADAKMIAKNNAYWNVFTLDAHETNKNAWIGLIPFAVFYDAVETEMIDKAEVAFGGDPIVLKAPLHSTPTVIVTQPADAAANNSTECTDIIGLTNKTKSNLLQITGELTYEKIYGQLIEHVMAQASHFYELHMVLSDTRQQFVSLLKDIQSLKHNKRLDFTPHYNAYVSQARLNVSSQSNASISVDDHIKSLHQHLMDVYLKETFSNTILCDAFTNLIVAIPAVCSKSRGVAALQSKLKRILNWKLYGSNSLLDVYFTHYNYQRKGIAPVDAGKELIISFANSVILLIVDSVLWYLASEMSSGSIEGANKLFDWLVAPADPYIFVTPLLEAFIPNRDVFTFFEYYKRFTNTKLDDEMLCDLGSRFDVDMWLQEVEDMNISRLNIKKSAGDICTLIWKKLNALKDANNDKKGFRALLQTHLNAVLSSCAKYTVIPIILEDVLNWQFKDIGDLLSEETQKAIMEAIEEDKTAIRITENAALSTFMKYPEWIKKQAGSLHYFNSHQWTRSFSLASLVYNEAIASKQTVFATDFTLNLLGTIMDLSNLDKNTTIDDIINGALPFVDGIGLYFSAVPKHTVTATMVKLLTKVEEKLIDYTIVNRNGSWSTKDWLKDSIHHMILFELLLSRIFPFIDMSLINPTKASSVLHLTHTLMFILVGIQWLCGYTPANYFAVELKMIAPNSSNHSFMMDTLLWLNILKFIETVVTAGLDTTTNDRDLSRQLYVDLLIYSTVLNPKLPMEQAMIDTFKKYLNIEVCTAHMKSKSGVLDWKYLIDANAGPAFWYMNTKQYTSLIEGIALLVTAPQYYSSVYKKSRELEALKGSVSNSDVIAIHDISSRLLLLESHAHTDNELFGGKQLKGLKPWINMKDKSRWLYLHYMLCKVCLNNDKKASVTQVTMLHDVLSQYPLRKGKKTCCTIDRLSPLHFMWTSCLTGSVLGNLKEIESFRINAVGFNEVFTDIQKVGDMKVEEDKETEVLLGICLNLMNIFEVLAWGSQIHYSVGLLHKFQTSYDSKFDQQFHPHFKQLCDRSNQFWKPYMEMIRLYEMHSREGIGKYMQDDEWRVTVTGILQHLFGSDYDRRSPFTTVVPQTVNWRPWVDAGIAGTHLDAMEAIATASTSIQYTFFNIATIVSQDTLSVVEAALLENMIRNLFHGLDSAALSNVLLILNEILITAGWTRETNRTVAVQAVGLTMMQCLSKKSFLSTAEFEVVFPDNLIESEQVKGTTSQLLYKYLECIMPHAVEKEIKPVPTWHSPKIMDMLAFIFMVKCIQIHGATELLSPGYIDVLGLLDISAGGGFLCGCGRQQSERHISQGIASSVESNPRNDFKYFWLFIIGSQLLWYNLCGKRLSDKNRSVNTYFTRLTSFFGSDNQTLSSIKDTTIQSIIKFIHQTNSKLVSQLNDKRGKGSHANPQTLAASVVNSVIKLGEQCGLTDSQVVVTFKSIYQT